MTVIVGYILQAVGITLILSSFTLQQALGIFAVVIGVFVWLGQKIESVEKRDNGRT